MPAKKVLHIFSVSVFTILLVALFVPFSGSGRVIAAILLLPPAVLMPLMLKKRNIQRITTNQVILLMTVIALLYVMLYYLTGLSFGFYKNPYRLTFPNFFKFFLPIAAIIVFSEIIRFVTLPQNDRFSSALCWFSCVIAEMLICSSIPSVTSFNRFMDLIAGAMLPAIISNSLYHYLARRYGIFPNLIFRLLTILHAYTFPVTSGISDSLVNFARLFIPIATYFFIDSLFEKKRRYAMQKTSRFTRILSKVLTILVVIIMTGTVMLVSNHFRFGAYVIATESMTGELNKGDVAICERYEEQFIQEGQVIVFEQSKSVIVHRVVDIQIINGITRYYTKGDANENLDAGFITDADILGLVNYKLPFLGFPTLWMRSLFRR
jgi:signal peptidase